VTDPFDPRLTLTREERRRLYPTEAAISEQMVQNHFEAQATEALFRDLFTAFVKREVAK
jgi:hypothetical protein